jgi:hypothetical protein
MIFVMGDRSYGSNCLEASAILSDLSKFVIAVHVNISCGTNMRPDYPVPKIQNANHFKEKYPLVLSFIWGVWAK